jgi:predicted transcriptional regulator
VRTTLTLDEDVASRLKSEARKSGRPFKQVVNEALREGLAKRPAKGKVPPFKVKARSMGLYPGLNYDNIGELLEQIEGPLYK